MSAVTQGSLVSPRGALRAQGLAATRDAFRGERWHLDYRHRVATTDVLVVSASIMIASFVRALELGPAHTAGAIAIRVGMSVGLASLWMIALALGRAYDPRVFGSGPLEYHRVFNASWKLFSIVTVAAFLVSAEAARTYVLIALPVGLVGLLAARFGWRRWLHRHRVDRGMTTAVLAIGLRDQAERLIRELNGRPTSGYRVVGVCTPTGTVRAGDEISGVPVLGDLRNAGMVAAQVGADCVAVSGSDAITADVVRRLGWELEPVGVDLMVGTERV